MGEGFSGIVRNALFAMADMLLDLAKEEDVYGQRENLVEFIVDCYNLKEEQPEFVLLREKFEEEFEESAYFSEMSKDELTKKIEEAINRLFRGDGIPLVVQKAIDRSFQ